MIPMILTILGSVLIFAGAKFVFSPYFNWKKQQELIKKSTKSNVITVTYKGQTIGYNDFKSQVNTNPKHKLSIVIPAYNEEKRLGKTLEETIKFFKNINYEIILINDASKDATQKVALSFQEFQGKSINLKVVSYTTNRGKGGAVRLGMLIASGERILMMDADLATDLNDFAKLNKKLDELEKNKLGLITGSRNNISEDVNIQRKPIRKFIGLVYNFIVNTICGVGLKDTQCGFKLFTYETAQKLFKVIHLERWAFDVEIFMIAKKIKAPFTEVPVNWHDVEGSHLNVFTASITMARDFLMVRLLYLLGVWKYTDNIGI